MLNLPKSNHGISETPHSNAGFEKTMSVSTDDDDTANDAETEPKRNRPKEDLQVVELDGSIGRSQRSPATFRCALEYMDPGVARSWWVDYWRVKSKTLIQKKGKLKKTLLLLSIGKIPKKDKPKSLCMYIYIYMYYIMVDVWEGTYFPKRHLPPKSLLKSRDDWV